MNKTITSNIAGYVFHIDENAFDKLDAYLNTIRSYFTNSQGKDEIIADIEARLAEMLQERVGDMKQVVTMEDVNHVIEIMGRPEAFLEDDPDTAAWTEQKSEPKSESGPRRLFRDPDNRVAAGVCSGISHYIGFDDPIWVRLIFVISALVSFGPPALLIYFILYLIIPEAKTTADKLQMRGENVTVSNIEKRVKEELEAVKNSWNDLNKKDGAPRKVGNAINRTFSLAGNLFMMFLKFLSRIVGFTLLMAGIFGFLSILTIPLGLPTIISISNDGAISSDSVQGIMHNFVGGSGSMTLIMISVMLMCGVPLLLMAFVGSKLLFQYRSHTKGIALSLIALWMIGIIMSIILGVSIATDFSSEGSNTKTIELPMKPNPGQSIFLGLNHELGDSEPLVEADIFHLDMLVTGHSSSLYRKPKLNINMAQTGGPKLIVTRLARAQNKQGAVDIASEIEYDFIPTDSSILFNGYFGIPEDELWKTQNVELELLLPLGYSVYLSDELRNIIHHVHNVSNTRDRDMLGRKWLMTREGLACTDCEEIGNPKILPENSIDQDIDSTVNSEIDPKQQSLEIRKDRLEQEMKKHQEELKLLDSQIDQDFEFSEGSERPKEIILKRVINASYWIGPTTFKNINISYPG